MSETAMPMNEKRLHPRFHVGEEDVRASTRHSTEVVIHDIGPAGVSISGPKRLSIGGEYELTFRGECDALSVSGVVRREMLVGARKVSREEVIPIYMAGIEFGDVLTERAEHIIDFIKKTVDVKEKRLKGFRVKIPTCEKAVLCCVETYSVKALSLSGMLFEMKHALPAENILQLELTLSDDHSPIHFRGKTAHCQEVDAGGVKHYRAGIEFIDMRPDDTTRLKEFIDLL